MVNSIWFDSPETTLYDLVTPSVVGCWMTPFNVINKLWLFGAICERTNTFVDPSPVKLSTTCSWISNLPLVSPVKLPKKISLIVGAVLKTNISRTSTAYPSVNVRLSFGFWITLLIAILTWVAFVMRERMPFPWVILNFVFTPSNATFNVWDIPLPTAFKLIAVRLDASDADDASLIVCAVS